MIFLDTSSLYALADRRDTYHERARAAFTTLLDSQEELITHNYVIVESAALIQHRLGIAPAIKFLQEIEQFSVVWVDKDLHSIARKLFEAKKKRTLSFVDCTSFALMEKEEIESAFAFDDDFRAAGFKLIP